MKKLNLEQYTSKVKISKKIDDNYTDEANYFGYRILKECISQNFLDDVDVTNRIEQTKNGEFITEEDLEIQIYLYFLENLKLINKNKLNIIELGLGFGGPSLTIAGIIDNTDIFKNVNSYNVIGIEGEYTHYEWSKKILSEQIKGNVNLIHGAVTTYDGTINFHQGNPADNYGQSIGGNFIVDCFRLDTIIKSNSIDVVDFLHIDIQGEELNVINDSIHLFDNINFMYIGTHSSEIHYNLLKIINESNKFNILLDVPINETTHIPGHGTIKPYKYMDGLIFCQNKNIK